MNKLVYENTGGIITKFNRVSFNGRKVNIIFREQGGSGGIDYGGYIVIIHQFTKCFRGKAVLFQNSIGVADDCIRDRGGYGRVTCNLYGAVIIKDSDSQRYDESIG